MEQIKQLLNSTFEKFSVAESRILHLDQSWQCQHTYFKNELEEDNIVQSRSRKGNCYNNCIIDNVLC